MNPADPIEAPSTITPKELWRISGDEDDEFLFGVLSQIVSDEDGNIYLLDAQLNEVMIFSPAGEYIRSIGREGEGPGEFRRASDMFLTADGNVAVLQRMPGKIVVLTPEGEPVGNLPVPEPEDGGMQMFARGRLAGDNVILSTNRFARNAAGFEMTLALIAVDASGAQTATYLTRTEKNDFANMVYDEKTGIGALVWNAGRDGRVFISDDFDAYRVQIWNPDGTLDHVIEREYESRDRSEEEMKRSTPVVRIRSGHRAQSPEVKTSKTDRNVQQIVPREDGSVWVLSSKGAFDAGDGVIATFDVFDRGGQFTRQVTINGEGSYKDDGFHIVKDRLCVITGLRSARRAMFGGREGETEEEDTGEPMSVICYDLGPVVQTMK
jgi:hypothetical protein